MKPPEATEKCSIAVEVNGKRHECTVDAQRLLVHFLREDLDLPGTHIGCDTGNCGACTIILDGCAQKSCLILAPQADGTRIRTVEGLANDDGLSLLQRSFITHHALQCGYCTPGMLMSATALLEHNPHPSDDEVLHAIQGNVCRCTGYQNILKAIRAAGDGEEAGV